MLHESDDGAVHARSPGAPGAVDVVLVVGRRIEVHHATHGIDVDASGGHVGGDQRSRRTRREPLQRPLPLGLGAVAVDGDGGDPGLTELLDQPVGAALGPAEHDGRAVAGDQIGGQRDAAVGVGPPEQVAHLARLAVVRRDLVPAGLVLVPPHQCVDRTVQRGREQHGLAVGRGEVEQPLDGGKEAHVGHAVGLVHDHDRHRREIDGALRDQILEPAGAGHDDVHSPVQRGPLRAVADAAVDGCHPAAGGRGERGQLPADLLGQLPGRDEDEPARPLRARGRNVEGEREAEGQRLAGTRRRPAGDVVAGQRVGQGRRLDGERGGDAAPVEHGDEIGGQAEPGEGGGQGRLQFEGDERPARVDPFLGDALRAHRRKSPASVQHRAGRRSGYR